MVFNSLAFIAFFAAVLLLHNLPFSWSIRKFNLLIASYLFYAAWNPPLIVLLWVSTLVSWWAAGQIHRQLSLGRRRAWLALSLAVNLGLLGYLKYGAFLLHGWQLLMATLGVTWVAPRWNIVLPLGISFYTLQSMSYALDVYHRRTQPIPKLLDFALFVTFFTQLVAGPILRTSVLAPQLAGPRRVTRDQLLWGLALMTLGMFEKVVLADGALAPAADAVFNATHPLGALDAWLGTMAFSGQILCEFAGYSTIAIGTALCLGFSIPDNFRFPYAAIGIADFWRRWNISLSTWLRDYLYIPLGGNRLRGARGFIALMVTMLLGALWYGAGWTFLAWGLLHGIYLAAERWLRSRGWTQRLPLRWPQKLALMLLTWLLVDVAWVLFRADSFHAAWQLLTSMAGGHADAPALLPTVLILETLLIVAGILVAHSWLRERTLEGVVARTPWWIVGGGWAAMLFAVIITQGAGNASSYFRF